MHSAVSTALRLTAALLALSLIAEGVMRVTLHVSVPWFFYATMSGGLLGFIPSAPILMHDRRATVTFRLTLGIGLLVLVLMNCWLVALVNHSDLGWSRGDYMLAFPVFVYAIVCIAGFYALPQGRNSPS